MKLIFSTSKGTYGVRRIKTSLKQEYNIVAACSRISRLMKIGCLSAKQIKKFVITTDSKHNEYISPNLLQRNLTTCMPNQVWVGDITYIPTNSGALYLATVIDLYSRKIVGYSMANHMRTSLIEQALLKAIWQRKPGSNLMFHSEQGSQYASHSYRVILKDHKITQSMSRKGNCWDNAVAESFFKTLKSELMYGKIYKNQTEAKSDIFEYIETFYNRKRLHSNNNYCSPEQFELLWA